MENPKHDDLRRTLETALARAGGPRTVWCVPSLTFATRIDSRRAILLGGAMAPQFVQDSAKNLQGTPFVRTLALPRVLRLNRADGPISAWMPFLESLARGGHSLLVMADSVEDEVLRTLMVNSLRGALDLCVVRPGRSAGDVRALGPVLDQLPASVDALSQISAAWIRRSATAVFLDSSEDRFVMETLSVIEVGGEDFEDQVERLRFLSGLIRERERGEG